MTSPFNWRDTPSEALKAIKPSPKARKNIKRTPIYGLSRKADEVLRDRFGGVYGRAVPSKGDIK